MGKSLEDLFMKEFRNEVSNVGYKDIYKVPLPPICDSWEVSGTELYAIKGIEKEKYNHLNKTIVRRLPKDTVAKRRVVDKVSRTFQKDDNGSYIYEDYPTPSGSLVLLSTINIELSYKEYKRPTKDGFGYIDFVQVKGAVFYMYVIPKKYLYRVNQTALALSVKNMKNYSGMGYMTWDMGMIFLHVIPYKPNSKYEGTRILKTGYWTDYSRDINTLLEFWQQLGVIPNLALCVLSDGSNIAQKGTVVGYESYSPVETLALSDKEIYGSSTDSEQQ